MKMAPAPGLEPGTKWLTATYSTIELCRSVSTLLNISPFLHNVNREVEFFLLFFTVFPFLSPKHRQLPLQKIAVELHFAYKNDSIALIAREVAPLLQPITRRARSPKAAQSDLSLSSFLKTELNSSSEASATASDSLSTLSK